MTFVVKDCVHCNLALPQYVEEIVSTKEFQRLKNLKQLGVSHFVFPAAVQTRAEHCIGTAYLCSHLLDVLEQNSEQQINELHKKCVIIAGLLHDIGHGPFSHLWEGVVHLGPHKNWTHEDQSKQMIEHMLVANNIRLDESSETHDKALKLITSLITGDSKTWSQLLTPAEMFLTEIVSNKFCNIDVDKCDYLLRDSQYLKEYVEVKPFIGFLSRARILYDSDGVSHIYYHQDDFELIENLFYNRAYFHMNIYQQHQVAAAEKMVKDICITGSAGGVKLAGFQLVEVQENSNAFTQLDDSVLDLIANSDIRNQFSDEAKKLITDLYNDHRYSLVWESCDSDGTKILDELENMFGAIFCVVGKFIPSAEVPSNIPLYNDDLLAVQMTSGLKLGYKSQMIYCTLPDKDIVAKVKNFVDSLNNNI